MRNTVVFSIVLIALFLSASFAAEPNMVAEPKAAVPTAEPIAADAVVATVNGVDITESQINAMIDQLISRAKGQIPEQMIPYYRQQARKQTVERLVVEKIIEQQQKKQNITAGEDEISARVDEYLKQQGLTIDEFKALLKSYGTDFSEFKKNIENRLKLEKLMEPMFEGKVDAPTDEQIKAYYDENAKQFTQPEKIHVKHILIKTEDSNDPNQAKIEAKEKIQKILEQVKAGGDFEKLAKENSACPSAAKGGDLGSAPKGSFVPEFEKAAYALEPNQVSDIVETNFGYHIIKLIDRTEASTTSLEDEKEKIAEFLLNQQKEKIASGYIKKAIADADIKFANPADDFTIVKERPAPPVRQPEAKTEKKVEKTDKKSEKADKKAKKK